MHLIDITPTATVDQEAQHENPVDQDAEQVQQENPVDQDAEQVQQENPVDRRWGRLIAATGDLPATADQEPQQSTDTDPDKVLISDQEKEQIADTDPDKVLIADQEKEQIADTLPVQTFYPKTLVIDSA